MSLVRACRCAGATLTRATFTTAGSATTARSRSTPAHSSVPGAPTLKRQALPHSSVPGAPTLKRQALPNTRVDAQRCVARSTERCDGHSRDPHAHICRDSPTDRAPVSMRDAQSACKPVPAHKKRLQSYARRTAPRNRCMCATVSTRRMLRAIMSSAHTSHRNSALPHLGPPTTQRLCRVL